MIQYDVVTLLRICIPTTNVQIRVVVLAITSLRILCCYTPPVVRSATVARHQWGHNLRLQHATVACYQVSAKFPSSLPIPPFTCRATRNTVLPAAFPV